MLRSRLLFALWSALLAPAALATEGPAVDPQMPRVDFRGTILYVDNFMGHKIRFSYRPGEPAAEFDSLNLKLDLQPGKNEFLFPRPGKAARGPYPEKLVAGKPKEPGIALLGADRSLRLFDIRAKKELWRVKTPATVQALNFTTPDQCVVAALGDGTIRWFRASDGAEMMAFFPHPDRKRWVAWTPLGNWESSPEAEQLFAWQQPLQRSSWAITRMMWNLDPEKATQRGRVRIGSQSLDRAVDLPSASASSAPPVPPPPPRPNLYLLAVGVSAYTNPSFRLDFPAKDAADVAAAWKAQEGKLYGKVETRVLANAGLADIQDGLEWLEKQTTANDVAVLFFAGHGINDPRTGEYWFLPREADLGARRRTLLSHRDLESVFASIPGKVLFFIDTCHSGNLLGGKSRDVATPGDLLAELQSAGRGVVVFSATTGAGLAQEDVELGNGAFTKALVEALQGKADGDGDRSLWVTEIESYLGRRVRDLTGGLQTPTTAKPANLPDFPLALLPR